MEEIVHIVCGYGEIGQAIGSLISGLKMSIYSRGRFHTLQVHDPEKGMKLSPTNQYNCYVLHICFPYAGPEFIHHVKEYMEVFEPTITIIHSTVPVGTTRKIGGAVVHSPCHGLHPDLAEGIKRFPKQIGHLKIADGAEASAVMTNLGVDYVKLCAAEESEFTKLACSIQYAWNIVLCKELEAECKKLGVNFDSVYTWWNGNYNHIYDMLGYPEYVRPILTPVDGPIGGHCLIPNAKLYKCWLTEQILARNEVFKGENRDDL